MDIFCLTPKDSLLNLFHLLCLRCQYSYICKFQFSVIIAHDFAIVISSLVTNCVCKSVVLVELDISAERVIDMQKTLKNIYENNINPDMRRTA